MHFGEGAEGRLAVEAHVLSFCSRHFSGLKQECFLEN